MAVFSLHLGCDVIIKRDLKIIGNHSNTSTFSLPIELLIIVVRPLPSAALDVLHVGGAIHLVLRHAECGLVLQTNNSGLDYTLTQSEIIPKGN